MPQAAFKNLKKNIRYAIIPGCLIGLFITVGYVVKHEKGFVFSWAWLGMSVLACAFAVVATVFLFALWDRRNSRVLSASVKEYLPNRLIKKSWVYFFVMTGLLIILWMPVLLALYPGLYAYDASWQYDMYCMGAVSEHHPVIHTYIVGWIIDTVYTKTGMFNKAILVYTLLQELLMAVGCGFIFYEFHRRKSSTWMHILALAFFCLYPPFVIFVFTSTKDSLFAIAVADCVFLLLGMFEDVKAFWSKRANRVLFVVFALEVIILRNNSIYAVILTLPFIIVFVLRAREVRFKAIRTLAITAVIFLLYKYPFTNAVAVGGVSKAEMLSVPCQQIMRIFYYHGDELPAEEKALVDELFDRGHWGYYFNPYIADASKGCLREETLNERFGEFRSLWFEWFKRYPGEYVDSFLENTYGFWYPWPIYVLQSLGGEGYTTISVIGPGEANTKIPALLEFFKLFENGDIVMGNGWVSWLFAPATFFYIAMAVAFYMLKSKRKALGIPFVYLGLLWLTYLLGPVAMVRYALYLYALVPVWPAYISSRQ